MGSIYSWRAAVSDGYNIYPSRHWCLPHRDDGIPGKVGLYWNGSGLGWDRADRAC